MLDYHSVGSGIKARVGAFLLAMVGMVALIAWIAHSSWHRTSELREKFTGVQIQSFQIAGHFQQAIWELNDMVLSYGVYQNTNDWAQFDASSKELLLWMDSQQAILPTDREKQLLDQIAVAFEDYLGSAQQIETKIRTQVQPNERLSDFAAFQKQSQNVLKLSFRLANAHQQSLKSFLDSSQNSLTNLRYVLLGALALLGIASGGLALVVYRGVIAPLRVRLVESQSLMERQEKLASLGMLAAGVAHEVRNPLTAIKGWLFLQKKRMSPGSRELADAEVISNEVGRLERIVKDVLLFAKPSDPQLSTVSSSEPLLAVQSLLAPQLAKANIRLTCEPCPPIQLSIDSQQIEQVLINLVQNAADSIGQTGTITLRSRLENKRLGDRLREVVILEVEDTGKGIQPEVEKRLFDPFFTTKDSGTGLGLSIAARIVEKHGGALQYQTLVNRGTTFGIVLPRI